MARGLDEIATDIIQLIVAVGGGNGMNGLPIDFESGTQLEQFYGPDKIDLSGLSDSDAAKAITEKLSDIHDQIGAILSGGI